MGNEGSGRQFRYDQRMVQFSNSLPQSTLDTFRQQSAQLGISMADYMRDLMADGLKYRCGKNLVTTDLDELQHQAGQWHKAQFGYLGNEKRFHAQVHKATEEMGELNNTAVRFICRKDDSNIEELDRQLADDCADVLFCLMTLCHMRGISLVDEIKKVTDDVTENRTYTEGVKD